MNKAATTAMTGVAVAMAAGTAAYMLSGHGKNSTGKKLKRNATKAVKTRGNVLDSVEYLMH